MMTFKRPKLTAHSQPLAYQLQVSKLSMTSTVSLYLPHVTTIIINLTYITTHTHSYS